MSKVKSLYFMACAALFFLAGCAETQKYEATEQICVANVEKPKAIEAAEDVLGQMHFTIDKADVEQGFIRTRPLTGAQFFEFWRSDNVGPSNSLQANLHSIRRIVELDINRQEKELCIGCDVMTQRLSLPEHEVSSSARAYEMFSDSTASMQKLILRPEQKKQMAWVNLDKDTKLAAEILKRIEEKLKAKSKK
jgi:hypothetical protein